MHLSSCRELKQRVLRRAYELPGHRGRRYRMRRARGRRRDVRVEEATPVAAVGIAPGRGREYRLAVRIFRGFESAEATLLAGLARHADEIDLVRRVRYRPRLTVRAGGSIGHFKISAGTLGGFVEDDDFYYILSNNHVLANSNCAFRDDPVLEPGPSDVRGGRFEVVGRLERWSPLAKEGRDGVDAALARFDDSVDFFEPWDYRGIGRIGKSPVSNRFSVARVTKRGRTTSVTRGTVSAYELDGVSIDYGTPSDPAIVTFDDQIEIVGDPPGRPFSQPGDSGSFVIDRDTLQPYALLYGGGADAQGIDRTLAHFMPGVLRALGVRLVQ